MTEVSASSAVLVEAIRIRCARAGQHRAAAEKAMTDTNTRQSARRVPKRTASARALMSSGMSSLVAHLEGGPPVGPISYERPGNGPQQDDDNKSFASASSMSSCGSIRTIGSTNSLEKDSRGILYRTRKIQSDRHLVRDERLSRSRPLALSVNEEEEEEEENILRSYCMKQHRQ